MADLDDDFSPEDVYKLFPTAFPLRPNIQEAHEPETTTAVTTYAGSTTQEPGLGFFYGVNGTWIFGEAEDSVILPMMLGILGLFSLLGNGSIMFVILSVRRMRTGPNMMLLNITASDVVFIVLCVPTAIVNHATPGGMLALPSVDVCKFVHYMLFVTVYVTIYSLVVACVFRFFGDNASSQKSPGGATNPLLSRSNAAISSLVIWVAFVLSHLNFLVQQEGAVFQEPFICLHSFVLPEVTKIRTLWVTFLTGAFLLPLLTICTLSAVTLHRQRRDRVLAALRNAQNHYRNPKHQQSRAQNRKHNADYAPAHQHHGFPQTTPYASPIPPQTGGYPPHPHQSLTRTPHHSQQYEVAQNELNEKRTSREITMVLMASMVARAICWLPIQVFVMIDIFGLTEITEVYRKAEMLGVCCAFAGTCVSPFLYNCLSRDFKLSYHEVFKRMGCRCLSDKAEEEAQSELNETILSILSDSSNHINYTVT